MNIGDIRCFNGIFSRYMLVIEFRIIIIIMI